MEFYKLPNGGILKRQNVELLAGDVPADSVAITEKQYDAELAAMKAESAATDAVNEARHKVLVDRLNALEG